MVRLPISLHAQVAETAHRYRRSMNSEIVARLENSLDELPEPDETKFEPPFFRHIETTLRRDLSRQETNLIRLFRRLSQRQRNAVTDLLSS
ncbi:MAG: Arc family DNA-binding protein [Gammaproteobacteria bacterium]|nr:Arc family DNA-binding protein [Gammaproteobacteria bacterium]